MPLCRVNFGAALVAALLVIACNRTGSASARVNDAGSSASASNAPTTNVSTPDPLLVAADHGRILGDSTAKTWVVVVSDFQCPFCKQWHDESYRALYDEYVRPGRVRVAYLNFPLRQHQHAMATAEAAMCAAAQGEFWEFHDALFATQNSWAALPSVRAVLDSIASTTPGLDRTKWTACVDSGKTQPLIMADRNRASAAGVESTPSFLIGDQIIAGAQPMDVLRAAINAELAKRATPAH